MVDSTDLPNVDINQIATDLNNKLDRDCLNYSDTGYNFMAGAGMPSNKYIDLTLGASGSTYTAPANGWVSVSKTTTASNQNLNIGSERIVYDIHSSANGQWLSASVPVKKGATFHVSYTAGGAVNWFYFIYAQGSESEAS